MSLSRVRNMPVQKQSHLTPSERHSIILKVINNPKIKKVDIDVMAGIKNPQSELKEDIILSPWIADNTLHVFGEGIDWRENFSLTNVRGISNNRSVPDFIGIDKSNSERPVIVEVKFTFHYPGDSSSDLIHKSIGQILQYRLDYMRKYPSTAQPRLFIVSIDYSEVVDEVCHDLQERGIALKHIAIEKRFK